MHILAAIRSVAHNHGFVDASKIVAAREYRSARIDAREVTGAGVPGRNVDLTVTQREPDHSAPPHPDRNTKSAAADEGHQRRRIDRTLNDWTWDPAPTAAHHNPPAVVIGRIAPRHIGHPVISPSEI